MCIPDGEEYPAYLKIETRLTAGIPTGKTISKKGLPCVMQHHRDSPFFVALSLQ